MGTDTGNISDKNKSPEIPENNFDANEYESRLGLLQEVAEKLSSTSEVSELLQQILGITQEILQASASSFLLVDQKAGKLYFQATEGIAGRTLKQMRIDIGSGIAGLVVRKKMPLLINDVKKDKRFNNETDKISGFVTKSILAVPLLRAKKVIGVLEVINKVNGGEFNERDLSVLSGFASTEALILLVSMLATAVSNVKLNEALIKGYKGTVEALVAAADEKDPHARGHSQRVRGYTLQAIKSFSLSSEDIQAIEFGALLHDIGKIGINEDILRKPGPLTDQEWRVMREHPTKGAKIVSEIPLLEKAKYIVLYHHERYDGKGYPVGIDGKNTPLGARLVAVADAFDTMTTGHSYRAALSVDEALNELIKCSSTQFCPVAVEAFVSAYRQRIGKPEKKEAEHQGEVKVKGEIKEAEETKKAAKAKPDSVLYGELYEGEVLLEIAAAEDYRQVMELKKHLCQIQSLDSVILSWSEDKGVEIIIWASKPMPLIDILREMPLVEQVVQQGRKTRVILKAK